jgi:hypothetical protein
MNKKLIENILLIFEIFLTLFLLFVLYYIVKYIIFLNAMEKYLR